MTDASFHSAFCTLNSAFPRTHSALPLAEVSRRFTIAPAFSPWILIPVTVGLVIMIYYLYSAQRQIASRKIVGWLTGIRIALILLLGILLLRPLWVWHRTEKMSETLWVVLDQSLSMAQTDPQAAPIERLRWADALGMLPQDARPSKLDRSAARLTTLHDELLRLQGQHPVGADAAETSKLAQDYTDSLKVWNDNLVDVAARLEKDPKIQGGDAVSIPKDLRDASSRFAEGVAKAAQHNRADEMTADIPWAKTGAAIQSVLTKLNPLATQTDLEYLNQHMNDAPIKDALVRTVMMRRADIAYAALTGKAHDLPKSLMDVFNRQNTKVITFAGGQQIIATANKDEIPKAIKAGIEPAGTSTDINDALKFVADQIGQNERASVLVVSDGRINDGGDPTDAAARLAKRGVRVFTLGVGSREVAPDASVDYVDAPEWVYKDDTLKASALLRLDGLGGQPAKVTFTRGDTIIDTQTITPTSNSVSAVVNFKDKPPEPGVYSYTIRIQEMPHEVVKENNAQNFRVTVKNDKLHVILVQDQPRWEDRYLANYLKRDQRVQLQQVWMEPARVAGIESPEKVKASPTATSDEAQTLPATAEEWSAFDLIVIGDVPTEYLSPETQRNIAKAVRDRGTTLLVVAGMLNMPARYTGQPLAELLPVHLSSNWSVSALADHMKHGFRPQVAPEGVNSIFSKLDLDDTRNAKYWTAMGLDDNKWYWHSEQTQAKQSASVYWQIGDLHPTAGSIGADGDSLTSSRQRALLASMPVGMGRVLYMSSEQTWRMRQVDGANLHERFWGQVIRWVVQSDLPAGGKFVRFGTSKPRYTAGDNIVVNIRLLKEDFTPRTGEKFKVIAKDVAPKDGSKGTVQGGAVIATADAVETPESPGMYRAVLTGLKPGGIELSLGDPIEKLLIDDPVATQKTLLVDMLSGTDREMRNVNADRNSLARIAQSGAGINTDIAYGDILAQHIPNLERPQETVQQIGLFADKDNPYTLKAHWAFLIVFVTLITTEWILRKVGGLV